MSATGHTLLLSLWALLLGACGQNAGPVEFGAAPRSNIRVVEGRGSSASLDVFLLAEAPGHIQSVGFTDRDVPLVISNGAVYELNGGTLDPRPVFAPSPEVSLGDARFISTRPSGGAWIGFDTELFRLDGFYLRAYDTGLSTAPRAVHSVTSGEFTGTWMEYDDGLSRTQDSELTFFPVDGLLASAIGPRHALLLTRDGLVRWAYDSDERLISESHLSDWGSFSDVAAGPSNLYAAGSQGVFRFTAEAQTQWTHFPLREGDDSAPLDAIRVDPITDELWLRSGNDGYRIAGDRIQRFDEVLHSDPILDRFGELIMADAATLFRASTGELNNAVSFQSEVLPWLEENCTQCHQNFTSYEVFSNHAADALARVQRGDMPRCAQNSRCETSTDYAVLLSWIRLGVPNN
ncbi:MAG: hypothetical protein AAFQ82_13790 [Myxococcota bacterium]